MLKIKTPAGRKRLGGGPTGLFGVDRQAGDYLIRARVMCTGHVTSRPDAYYHVTNLSLLKYCRAFMTTPANQRARRRRPGCAECPRSHDHTQRRRALSTRAIE